MSQLLPIFVCDRINQSLINYHPTSHPQLFAIQVHKHHMNNIVKHITILNKINALDKMAKENIKAQWCCHQFF
jgi:hypothetical protein